MATARMVFLNAAGALAVATGTAWADPTLVTVGTRSMIMKDSAFAGSRKFSFNVRSGDAPVEHQVAAPVPDTTTDPSIYGGELVVYNGMGSGEQFVIPLPPEKWIQEGNEFVGYRYVFSSVSPVWKVYVKGPKISVRGGKALWGYSLDEASQGSIAVRLTLGTDGPDPITWCSEALPASPVTENDRVNKFRAARLQEAPAVCPALP